MAAIRIADQASQGERPINPYVGPRAFRTDETLYGRDRELIELVDLLIAERVVLLYSPSGAGKTSLIQASLLPELQQQRFRPLPVARISVPLQGADISDTNVNRYMLSVMLSLESKLRPADNQRSVEQLCAISLSDYLRGELTVTRRIDHSSGQESLGEMPLVLIIDQFEEVLLIDPGDQSGQAEFFRQLGDALEEQAVWALLSMREDFLGGLDKFSYQLPNSLTARYRLDLLKRAAAKEAIQAPPKDIYDITLSDAATDQLIDNLSTVLVQPPGGVPEPEISPYVEGVILQTVCSRLWQEIDPVSQELKIILPEHLGDLKHVDRALAQHYSDSVEVASRTASISERMVRDWVENSLLTKQKFRNQTDRGPAGDPRKAYRCIRQLERQHLVRSEPRLNRPWYELIHDRFIEPLINDNADWRERNGFGAISHAARLWHAERSPELLLPTDRLEEGIAWLHEHEQEAYKYERDFIEESRRALNALQEQELVKLATKRKEAEDRAVREQLLGGLEQVRGSLEQVRGSRDRWRLAAFAELAVFILVIVIFIIWSR